MDADATRTRRRQPSPLERILPLTRVARLIPNVAFIRSEEQYMYNERWTGVTPSKKLFVRFCTLGVYALGRLKDIPSVELAHRCQYTTRPYWIEQVSVLTSQNSTRLTGVDACNTGQSHRILLRRTYFRGITRHSSRTAVSTTKGEKTPKPLYRRITFSPWNHQGSTPPGATAGLLPQRPPRVP